MSDVDLFGQQSTPDVQKAAYLSADGLYRFALHRWWGDGIRLGFVMLNPSTADAEIDDPTIRRCMGFARTLGFDGIRVVNLYAYRATKPADLWKADEPTGGRPQRRPPARDPPAGEAPTPHRRVGCERATGSGGAVHVVARQRVRAGAGPDEGRRSSSPALPAS